MHVDYTMFIHVVLNSVAIVKLEYSLKLCSSYGLSSRAANFREFHEMATQAVKNYF